MDPTRFDIPGSELAAAHAWLLGLARGLVVDEAQAEDVVQDAWVLSARGGLARARDWRAFLRGVVRIRARREHADARSRAARERGGARAEALPSAHDLAERLELARTVIEELAHLPEEQRTLLQLRYQEGLEPSAIARERGLPAGTVRSQLARARDALRARLDRRWQGRREDWAAIALLPLAPPGGTSAIAGSLIGALVMSTTAKLLLGLGVAIGIGWFVWRPRAAGAPVAPVREPAALETASRVEESTASPGLVADEPSRELALAAEEPMAAPPTRDAGREPARLRVIDSRTRESVPWFAVQVEAEGHEELLTSDAGGELALEAIRFEKSFSLVAADDPEDRLDSTQRKWVMPADYPEDGEALTFEVLVGPTYRLLFDEPPPGGEELVVSLAAGDRPGLEPASITGRVRPGDPPWTRLDPSHANTSDLGDGPWTLAAHDRAGHWLAWGSVHQIEGVQAQPVLLQARSCGALAVSATIDGKPIETRLYVGLYSVTDGAKDSLEERHATLYPADSPGFPGGGGHTTFGHLPPGNYVVWVGSPSTHQRAEAEVRTEETTRIAIDLTGDPGYAPLTVLLRSQANRVSLNGLVIMARSTSGDSRWSWAGWVQNRPDGSVEYRFDDLASGTWEVELEDTPHMPPFDRRNVLATPGGPPVEFVCLDADSPEPVSRSARVIDSRTREPIPFAGVTVYAGGIRNMAYTTQPDGTLRIGPYLPDVEVRVCVRAQDHRPSFVEVPFDEDLDTLLEVELDQGWGTLLEVVAQSGVSPRGEPLASVRVLLDGVLTGTTDEHGRLLLATDRRPAKVELLLEGYELAYGDIDPKTLAPSEQGLYPYFVVMKRAR